MDPVELALSLFDDVDEPIELDDLAIAALRQRGIDVEEVADARR